MHKIALANTLAKVNIWAMAGHITDKTFLHLSLKEKMSRNRRWIP